MKNETAFRYANMGYETGKKSPKPIREAIEERLKIELQGKYKEKYESYAKGFSLGVKDRRLLARKLELAKAKSKKNRSHDRSR